MKTDKTTLALAVDGGGTRCRIAVLTETERFSVESGSANATSDFDGAVHSIVSGLQTLASESDIALSQLHQTPTYLGVAGVTDDIVAPRLRAALPFAQASIEDDQPAAVRGALGNHNGCIAHCGTGSFLARQHNGKQKFAAGWGHILDDVASACWIGKRALSCTLYAADELVRRSELTDTLLSTYGNCSDIVAFAATATPKEFGQHAKLVSRLANSGDSNAVQILCEGASWITTNLQQLGCGETDKICLTGGLGPEYRAYLPEPFQAQIFEPQGSPLDGALALAMDFRNKIKT